MSQQGKKDNTLKTATISQLWHGYVLVSVCFGVTCSAIMLAMDADMPMFRLRCWQLHWNLLILFLLWYSIWHHYVSCTH